MVTRYAMVAMSLPYPLTRLLCRLAFFQYCIVALAGNPKPPVQCYGHVPKFTEGQYYYHDNDTYQLRLTTNVYLKMDLNYRSCFQIDIQSNVNNSSDEVSSLFYAIEYVEFTQYYPVRYSYQFGIPEFQSYCKCDCPKADVFCTHDFGSKTCSKGEICITKYFPYQSSHGCQEGGPATLCCEITVNPFESRRYHAISLRDPVPNVELAIEIYAMFQNEWVLFRRYHRNILPYKGNSLHLNGYENVADMNIFSTAERAPYSLPVSRYFFYEDTSDFAMREGHVNELHESDVNKLGWLRYSNSQWSVEQPLVSVYMAHQPSVINCKQQTYFDRYDVSVNARVIRNSTGAISGRPFEGALVKESYRFIKDLKLLPASHTNELSVAVTHSAQSAPTLTLDMTLHQKMTLITHIHASYAEDVLAAICLDKHSNRYLNVTLINAYGEFLITIYKEHPARDVDVVLSAVTSLPLAVNFSDILPLPGFIGSSRVVCVQPDKDVKRQQCKRAEFRKERVIWFKLHKSFVETEGMCPGCNEDTGSGFWNYLDPRRWINGINSVSEGVAIIVEIAFVGVCIILGVVLLRKLIWPLMRWACCSPAYNFRKTEIQPYSSP